MNPFVGAGSDHATFLFYAGIPVMDIMFVADQKVPWTKEQQQQKFSCLSTTFFYVHFLPC